MSYEKVAIQALKLYILISFFFVRNSIVETIFLCVLLIGYLALTKFKRKYGTGRSYFISRNLLPVIGIVVVCFTFSLFLAEYRQFYMVGSFICLLLMYELFFLRDSSSLICDTRLDWFYYSLFIVHVYYMGSVVCFCFVCFYNVNNL